jgi:type IV pilus assembly protein PilB
MVIFCKRCGSPVKLGNAQWLDPEYSAKCPQCQKPVALETLRAGARRPGTTARPGVPHAGSAVPTPEEPTPDRNHYLQKIRLFSGLPYEECALLEKQLHPREFAPQQTIVKEGGPGDAMFFITSGAVEVRKRDPRTGIDFLLTELTAGACFGEMALLTGRPRAASVVAVEPTSCSVLEQPAFDEVLLTSSKIGLAMSRVLAERLDEADDQAGIEHFEQHAAGAEAPIPISESGRSADPLPAEEARTLDEDDGQAAAEAVTDLTCSASDAPIIRIANTVLSLAIKNGATDIHIEPQEKEVAVRFRIDGTLHVVEVLPKKVQMGLTSRLKALARLDTAEKRLPQDGRMSVRWKERAIEFRVSTIPSKWGEKICLRLLDKSGALLGLEKLILLPDVLGAVREMIAQPSGLIYVSGPAGAGKITTIYGALAEINAPEVNISTAEEIIKYDLPRLNQVQLREEIGLDCPRILRAFLRQDANVIVVGETRDRETARLSIEAALAGRLVFTTLNANDAAGALIRAAELGADRFQVASAALGAMAQRLLRRLCPECKEAYTPDDISLEYVGLDPRHPVEFYRHRGCDKCSGTGYSGRVGVFEVLRMDAGLRRLVARGASAEAVTELAVKSGMRTMKNYAGWLLQNGWTTMSEVLQVIAA